MNFRLSWGVEDAHEVESWAPGIRLLGTWLYFDAPEVLARPIGVFAASAVIAKGSVGGSFRSCR